MTPAGAVLGLAWRAQQREAIGTARRGARNLGLRSRSRTASRRTRVTTRSSSRDRATAWPRRSRSSRSPARWRPASTADRSSSTDLPNGGRAHRAAAAASGVLRLAVELCDALRRPRGGATPAGDRRPAASAASGSRFGLEVDRPADVAALAAALVQLPPTSTWASTCTSPPRTSGSANWFELCQPGRPARGGAAGGQRRPGPLAGPRRRMAPRRLRPPPAPALPQILATANARLAS